MPEARLDTAEALVQRALEQPVIDAASAAWGFQNRTDIVTLSGGDRVVLQRYSRREDAEYRLGVIQALWKPAAAAGIALPHARAFALDDNPAWIIFDALPGAPVPEAAEGGVEGPQFPQLARAMGELLSVFRTLPVDASVIDRSWSDAGRLVANATHWAAALSDLDACDRAPLAAILDEMAALFDGRPVVLAHGDYSPVNVLSDGTTLTGLVDLESVRLADPLFDVAWWRWSVGFSPSSVLESAWPEFLRGAGVDPREPGLQSRIRVLQVLRMLELLAGGSLGPGVRRTVAGRLRATLRDAARI